MSTFFDLRHTYLRRRKVQVYPRPIDDCVVAQADNPSTTAKPTKPKRIDFIWYSLNPMTGVKILEPNGLY
ncbi:hypothetical protein Q4Q52_11395 [Shewanella sp. SP1S2-4]|uniref:hypothetical protein n=1 Tax=Shewanella TaxID=22 RepID=UPI00288DC2D8|nr:hypothetical protein [Shewanella sp. SP1S2-4]MDT3320377.1 hypothetical protein [Shewanella sp. SP1S2-4]